MSGIEPDTEGISSIESSSYCVFSVPSELSEDYALFTVSIIFLVILKAFHYITLEHYIGSF